jgi:hypothetical protein
VIERELTPDVIDDIRANGPIDDLRVLPIALSMDPPEGVDVERICLDLIEHPDAWVRGNAATGLGHLARVLRRLDHEGRIKRDLQMLLRDEEPLVCGRASDAISDIEIFLGWNFRNSEPDPRLRVPRAISTTACYRVYLLVDEESNILVERAIAPGQIAPRGDFAPDPRGLSFGYEWRLPGFSLTRPLSDEAQALEESWAMRYPKVWVNESNRFEEAAVVRTPTLSGNHEDKHGDWLEIRCRAYFLWDRKDNPWPPAAGIEQRWLTAENVMTGYPVGAQDRYALALFNRFYAHQTGAYFM